MKAFEFLPTLPLLPNAACRQVDNPNLFFPESRAEERKSLPIVAEICGSCIERKECLEYALTEKIPHGIWAGTTPAMRGFKYESKVSLFQPNTAGKIRALYNSGRTSQEIAETLGIGLTYINVTINRLKAKLEGEIQSQPTIEKPGEESPSSSGFQQ